jgi:hypothetical protein
MSLASIYDVGEAHILSANRFWWAHLIAKEYSGLSPHDVKEWSAEEVLETLAAIMLMDASSEHPRFLPK